MQIRQLSGPGLQAFPCNGSTSFVIVANDTIASPCSNLFLGRFQALQRAINSYVRRFGILDTIAVDGDIGPITADTAAAIIEHGIIKGHASWVIRLTSLRQLVSTDVYTRAFATAAGASVDNTPNIATTSGKEFLVGQGTVTPRPPETAKAGIGGILAISALAGVAAFKLLGRKKNRG